MSIITELNHNVKEPELNVIPEEIFHEKIYSTFGRISKILQKSIGPCGAPTVISHMPHYHVTKDGYTIAKNLMFENTSGYVDQVIAYMIRDICDRLNYVVGDGTTSAILCTDKIYQSFREDDAEINKLFFLPRDILFRLHKLKDRIVEKLGREALLIRDLPKEEMLEAIRNVAYISSNGDTKLTEMIVYLYDKLEYPAIRVKEADDGITKCSFSTGFDIEVQLTDKLYINTDANTYIDDNLSVLMFEYKVNIKTLERIILPALKESTENGRRLLVVAPSYDIMALREIQPHLQKQYATTGKISLVLTVCPTAREIDMKRFSDMAMLCNTEIITKHMENKYLDGKSELDNELGNTDEVVFHLGYVGSVNIGMDKAIFDKFNYNPNLYEAHLADASREYTDVLNKYKNTGAFNFEIDSCQLRLNCLKMKSGIIEVGANTSFAMAFEKDVVDDAVKATQSAFLNGIVIGEHVSMLRVLCEMLEDEDDPKDYLLLKILYAGFAEVNSAILENAFDDELFTDVVKEDRVGEGCVYLEAAIIKFDNKEVFDQLVATVYNTPDATLYDLIIAYEQQTNTALDLNCKETSFNGKWENVLTFSNNIINSTATDREILIAAVDLVGLLITGNQLIVAQPI